MKRKVSERARFKWVLLSVFLAAYFLFHLAYIDADTPTSLTYSPGAFCDEGYKTLSARNLVLFGKANWSEHDEYGGWVRQSPVTVHYNFILFKLFGVSLSVARLGNLLFGVGCLILFYLILKKMYDRKTALLGVVLCALNEIVFFYSRIALFEFKMVFFLLLGLYLALFAKNSYFIIAPAILSWIMAYYCKASAMVFYITILFYLAVSYKDSLVLRRLFRRRDILLIGVIVLACFVLAQYVFVYHREFYDSIVIFHRHYRSPMGTVLHWITQMFFTKNPVLVFLAVVYTGYLISTIKEGEDYRKSDLFFVTWLFLGTTMLSFMSHQPLRYYVYLVFPLVAVGVRCILAAREVWKKFLGDKGVLFKGAVVGLGAYLFIGHLFVLRLMPVRTFAGWDLAAIKTFAIFSVIWVSFFSMAVYVIGFRKAGVLERAKGYRISFRALGSALVAAILIIQIFPIARWALNPRYDLNRISRKIMELNRDSILVGDWAAQLCVNTDKRVLRSYAHKSGKWSTNFENLGEVKPDFLVITRGVSEHMLDQFRLRYAGVVKDGARWKFEYAGRGIEFYELDFGSGRGSYLVDNVKSRGELE
jgi:4-amino-4-deoxy-L-arabinose transferase-like glycosyltransferase